MTKRDDPETLALSVETQNGMEISRSYDALGRPSGFALVSPGTPKPATRGQSKPATCGHPKTLASHVPFNYPGLRLSLAGSQSKLPVLMRQDSIALPLGNTPSTHIIKPEPERFPGLVATEVLCMTLARTVGLNVPPVSIRPVGNKPCLVVQRFDRSLDANGAVTRVHQEDFCQAMGFPPERSLYHLESGTHEIRKWLGNDPLPEFLSSRFYPRRQAAPMRRRSRRGMSRVAGSALQFCMKRSA